MKKSFDIEYAVNRNLASSRSTVSFVATSGAERYDGTFEVDSVDDREIEDSLNWNLAEHIRQTRKQV